MYTENLYTNICIQQTDIANILGGNQRLAFGGVLPSFLFEPNNLFRIAVEGVGVHSIADKAQGGNLGAGTAGLGLVFEEILLFESLVAAGVYHVVFLFLMGTIALY